ncbi:MAG: flavin reductase family protein [Phycisphaeraceae bacterium]
MKDPSTSTLDAQTREAVNAVLSRIPCGRFLLTAGHDGRTRGVLVSWVQQVSAEPAMVLVALEKGREIVPLIHESHSFALSQVAADDKLTLRKFSADTLDEDPLESLEIMRRATGSPILARTQAFVDCELVRHLDIEGDHDLYVGVVRDGGLLKGGAVHVEVADGK